MKCPDCNAGFGFLWEHSCTDASATLKCDRDHCTPEERAVINAATKRREVYLKYGEAYHEYDTDLDNACDTLLTARAKPEENEPT